MLKKLFYLLIGLLIVIIGLGIWLTQFHFVTQRDGTVSLAGLQDEVAIQYDENGVAHIEAKNQNDLYLALGYTHAKDRLFQMELMRRLAEGQLAEIFGEDLIETDTLFRTLGLHAHAKEYIRRVDTSTDSWKAMEQYIAGVNAFQSEGNLPIEFAILGITPRPFKPEDSIAVSGYIAYSFAVGFKTEPLMSFVADTLGNSYLDIFDFDPDTPIQPTVAEISKDTYLSLANLARVSTLDQSLGQFEGSNAWSISGSKTKSGKPILASDPHISFSVPGAWYEAHLKSPGFEFYGYHQALIPVALMGHNRNLGWGVTMFQNDDMDFYLEKSHPVDKKLIYRNDKYETLSIHTETINIKGGDTVDIEITNSSIGPIINNVYKNFGDTQLVSLWWAFLKTPNPLIEAFYDMSHAGNLQQFQSALEKVHSPGLNFMYADSKNNIAWWSAGLIPKRPAHVSPWRLLDGSTGNDLPTGFYDFSYNPQLVNPEQGYIVSANQRPDTYKDLMVPGYYNLPARAELLNQVVGKTNDTYLEIEKDFQRSVRSTFAQDAMVIMMGALNENQKNRLTTELLTESENWNGEFQLDSIASTLFIEWQFAILETAFKDELGEDLFQLFLETRKSDHGFFQLMQKLEHPWWSLNGGKENRTDILSMAFDIALERIELYLGSDQNQWNWSRHHPFEQKHPLGSVKPLNQLFNIGPAPVPGSHAVPNNLSQKHSTGTQWVNYGPSTRRLIDFATPETSLSILPAGQSGNPFDKHFDDQFQRYVNGQYREVWLDNKDIRTHRSSTLILTPAQ